MDKIRVLALGGLDEDGRNMTVFEINEDIYVVDAGVRYPQTELLGVEVLIPDMKYLVENKGRVRAIIITHGHDDTMGALPYLIKEINVPVYTTPLNALMIERELKQHQIRNAKIFKIHRNTSFKIGSRRCYAFGLTHSIPDSFGIAIESDQGYLVHSSEFMIDFDVHQESFATDISYISEIGKKGVFMLLAESVSAKREGFTSPHHRITKRIEKVFEEAEGRILVTMYEQNIYRLIEVIEMAKRFRKKIYFYGEKQLQLVKYLDNLNYYTIPKGMILDKQSFDNAMQDVVIVVSDVGPDVFTKMTKIAMGEDLKIQLNETDQVIVASPQVPGTEKIGNSMVDELFKDGVKVHNMNYKDVLSMHASVEDLKMMISLMKPTYYMPVKGEYQNLAANANVAVEMGILPTNIVILDNGQIAEFQNGRLKSTSEVLHLEDVMIDGKDHLDTSGLVLRDRQTLATDGALIVGMVLNHKTKEVLGGPDVQSRGVIYLKDAEDVMSEVGKILERTILKNVEEKKYDNIGTRNEARELISKFVFKQTGKRPIVLPVIIEITL